jgi:hypothetical protein
VIDGAEAAEAGEQFSLSSRGRVNLAKRKLDCEHETPLHIAARKGATDLAQLLLTSGQRGLMPFPPVPQAFLLTVCTCFGL